VDLNLAKKRLTSNGLSLSVVKNGKVLFESKDHGVQSMIEAVQRCGSALYGGSVADRVIGKAAALLCLYSKTAAIYAGTMSENAAELLTQNQIPYRYDILVPRILNRSGSDMCPFEKAVLEVADAKVAFEILRSFDPSKPEPTDSKSLNPYNVS
jgi:hypothetical protein